MVHVAGDPGFIAWTNAVDANFSTYAAFGGTVAVGTALGLTGYQPAYEPAAPKLGVTGHFRAHVTSYEHKISNNWGVQNVLAIQNTSNTDAYSAIRFLDYNGREATAFGYGNPGTSNDLPFAGAAYWESSSGVNADGSADNTQDARPMRIVQSGKIGGTYALYCRQEFMANGDIAFMNLNAGFSGVTRHSRFKANGGLQLGSATGTSAGVPPAVQLDAVGTVLSGDAIDSVRTNSFSGGSGSFAFTSYHTPREQLRLLRANVVKADFLVDSSPLRLTIGDPDHSCDPFCVSLDGDRNVGIGDFQSWGTGQYMLGIKNTPTPPSTSPSGGGLIYVQSGALKFKGSSGTVTTIAPA